MSKKHTLIVGKRGTGKTNLLNELAGEFENSLFNNPKHITEETFPLRMHYVKDRYDFIGFDELYNIKQVESYLELITSELKDKYTAAVLNTDGTNEDTLFSK